MSDKPVIANLDELLPHYARYRAMLTGGSAAVDNRLKGPGAGIVSGFMERSASYDAILFDAFGVLNRGGTAIAGAAETIAAVTRRGQPFYVVSNNASNSPARIAAKLQGMGFDIPVGRIVASGQAVPPWLAGSPFAGRPYYLVGTGDSRDHFVPDPESLMVNHPGYRGETADAECVIVCSNRDFYSTAQQAEVDALLEHKKVPLILANPDLISPIEGGFYAVAGYTAAQLAQRYGVEMVGVGKPFSPIFQLALERLGRPDPARVLMVGDTLDTDISGARALGMDAALTLSGLYQGQEKRIDAICSQRGIVPDFIVPSIAD